MGPLPDPVYRRLNFVDWATDAPVRWQNGGHGIQRMVVDTWLEAVEWEEQLGERACGAVLATAAAAEIAGWMRVPELRGDSGSVRESGDYGTVKSVARLGPLLK
jgi:hypothetical protein